MPACELKMPIPTFSEEAGKTMTAPRGRTPGAPFALLPHSASCCIVAPAVIHEPNQLRYRSEFLLQLCVSTVRRLPSHRSVQPSSLLESASPLPVTVQMLQLPLIASSTHFLRDG